MMLLGWMMLPVWIGRLAQASLQSVMLPKLDLWEKRLVKLGLLLVNLLQKLGWAGVKPQGKLAWLRKKLDPLLALRALMAC